MPALLEVENLSKSIGILELFENISFVVNEGQKMALIAKNGMGKTTLLNILAGNDSPTGGICKYLPDVRVGYLSQDPFFNDNDTITQAVFKSDNEVVKLISEYEKAIEEHKNELIESLVLQLDRYKAWDFESRIKQVLSQLDIHNLNQKMGELSGGQRKRVALANVLINEPDMLILDEPTNHLDVEAIEWLEGYLRQTRSTLLMVTHDRYFLDRVCDEIIEIDNLSTYQYKGNYSYFLQKRADRIELQELEVEKAKNLLRKEEDWMRRMPKARGTKARYRIDNYYQPKDKAGQRYTESQVNIKVGEERMGSKILVCKNVNFSWDGIPYIKDFCYTFNRFEKIGILGQNGCGKSTFLEVITGMLAPVSGIIDLGETIKIGYYRQKGIEFDEDQRVLDAVTEIAETVQLSDGSRITASQFLNHFLFPPHRQHDYIRKLSGGEKRRLYLCSVLMQSPNFLILDEPTNDLDIATLNVLEGYLQSFNGCVIIVSHDRYFMDNVVDHLFIFKGDGLIKDFPGNYSAYFEKLKEEKKQTEESKPKLVQKTRSEEKQVGKKLTYKERLEYDALELEIAALEEQKSLLEQKLGGGITDADEITSISNDIGTILQTLDEKTERWMELAERME